jgi:HAD superfamily hydrolase (TIGR01509 family)
MNPELIIFDCDGVLVDSEPISNKVLAQLLTEIGLPTSYEQSLKDFLGRSWPDIITIIETRFGKKPPDNLHCIYMNQMFAEFKIHLKPVKGIIKAISQISCQTCVASSGPHEKIKMTLSITNLYDEFKGRIFSAADVANGKPAPDLFLHAADKMSVDPLNTIVIEDSSAGIEAAIKANMKVLAYDPFGYNHHVPEFNGKTFSSMDQLTQNIVAL